MQFIIKISMVVKNKRQPRIQLFSCLQNKVEAKRWLIVEAVRGKPITKATFKLLEPSRKLEAYPPRTS